MEFFLTIVLDTKEREAVTSASKSESDRVKLEELKLAKVLTIDS